MVHLGSSAWHVCVCTSCPFFLHRGQTEQLQHLSLLPSCQFPCPTCMYFLLYPPPPVQATVNDQKLTVPTLGVAWTRVLLTHRNSRDTRVDRPQGVEAERHTSKELTYAINHSFVGGQVAAAFQKVGVSVRGLLSWMLVVTSGKVMLGQVMVKGRGGMENGCRNRSSPTMQGHVLQSSHPAHTQLPNNLHLWESDQRQHCNFLHQWTVCSTTANLSLSNTWCTILKTKWQNTLQMPSWPTELL